ncbi:MAG: J domain-containing protein [Myxococcales bacterium]|nr:J domain-containing protein [Myxococcales bacterium]
MDVYTPDHYRVLGLPVRADSATIKDSYRRLSRLYHPDRQGGSERAADCFKQIAAAYTDLSDPGRRLHYDRVLLLKDPLRLVEDPRAERALDVLDLVVTRLRRRPAALPGRERGRDLRVEAAVPFAVAALGGRIEVAAVWPASCGTCAGEGTTEPGRNPVCHVCLGHGQVRVGLRRTDQRCGFCAGRGAVLLAACAVCSGTGSVEQTKHVVVEVPSRTAGRTVLRVRSAGEVTAVASGPGDLLVDVRVEAHPLLGVQGDDLVTVLPLTWSQLAGGARVRVPTLEGAEWLAVPAGTPPEREFRIAGRGLPSVVLSRGRVPGTRGALIVRLAVDVPTGLGERDLRDLQTLETRLGPQAFVRIAAWRDAMARLDGVAGATRPES